MPLITAIQTRSRFRFRLFIRQIARPTKFELFGMPLYWSITNSTRRDLRFLKKQVASPAMFGLFGAIACWIVATLAIHVSFLLIVRTEQIVTIFKYCRILGVSSI
jgi:hypothetical protein